MSSRLLSLPKELREEIFSHALQPTVCFYFRDNELYYYYRNEDDDEEPRILLSYEIGPIPRSLLLIHPTITDDVRYIDARLRRRISKTIEEAIQVPDEDENIFLDRFVPEPSSEFLEIARNGRFILDVLARHAIDALDLIALSPILARNITYIGFHGFNEPVMNSLFKYCSAVETLALFCFPTSLNRWISTQSFLSKYANYGGRAGDHKIFSRLEYIVEDSDPDKTPGAIAKLPDHETTMRPTCKRRQMDTHELDERGRAVFFLIQGHDEKKCCIENTVITYEFTEPPLL
ncbi:uncharacterized protein DFL_007495 [Arthrobotrys flagrans]|uniref:Uncharacterized protein n=1 Tax=Arthrobotrys flagrans TaxID=97331 RepID=A0A436ZVU2_ARTFL|nr:hypothetical protein DFL_007495 [Arthrobotrys flagrans]